MELVTGIEPVTLSLPRIRSADWATPAYVMNGCGDRTWTCDLRVMSPTSYQLLHPAMNGGGRRIRTFEVEDGRFTVCSLWPLGNPSKNNGAGDRNWTHNLLITSQLLYRLSYASIPQHGILYIFLNILSIDFLAQIDILFCASVSRIALYYNSIGNIFAQVLFYKILAKHTNFFTMCKNTVLFPSPDSVQTYFLSYLTATIQRYRAN